MKLAALFLILTTTAASAQVVVLPPRHQHPYIEQPDSRVYQVPTYPRRHYCPPGTSWQYGCVAWSVPDPGEIVGACQAEAFSCKRIPGPIQ
jgi:hypothetical protein